MNWKQFKDEVDKQLEMMAISDDVEVWYIDTHPSNRTEVGYMVDLGIHID